MRKFSDGIPQTEGPNIPDPHPVTSRKRRHAPDKASGNLAPATPYRGKRKALYICNIQGYFLPFVSGSEGWKMGLEPTTPGTTIQCSNRLSYIHHVNAGPMRRLQRANVIQFSR